MRLLFEEIENIQKGEEIDKDGEEIPIVRATKVLKRTNKIYRNT